MFEQSAKFNMVLSLAPIGLAVLLGVLMPGAARNQGAYAWAALLLYVVGFAGFASAKVAQFKKGIIFSVGTSGMPPWQRWAYRGGYVLMVAGLFTTIALVLASRSWRG